MALAPIILFTYNRPEHLKKSLKALKENYIAKESDLLIFSDGPVCLTDEAPILEIRNFLYSLDGFKNIRIIERDHNLGLAQSIIQGVDFVFEKSEKVIVLEDDLITSPDFLSFMNDCLDTFEKPGRVFSIAGYSPGIDIPGDYTEDTYLSYRPSSWGWATWKDRWLSVDWSVKDFSRFILDKESIRDFNKSGKDSTIMLLKQMTGKINSWAIRFHYACYKRNGLCVYPRISRIQNTGTDGSGTHLRKTRKYDVPMELSDTAYVLNPDVRLNEKILKNFSTFFTPSLIRRTINYLKLRKYYINS